LAFTCFLAARGVGDEEEANAAKSTAATAVVVLDEEVVSGAPGVTMNVVGGGAALVEALMVPLPCLLVRVSA